MITKAFIELTSDQLNSLITASNIRLGEIKETYEKCKAAGKNADYYLNEYWRLKKAIIMLEQPDWRTIE